MCCISGYICICRHTNQTCGVIAPVYAKCSHRYVLLLIVYDPLKEFDQFVGLPQMKQVILLLKTRAEPHSFIHTLLQLAYQGWYLYTVTKVLGQLVRRVCPQWFEPLFCP
jgi:hypothetical protein